MARTPCSASGLLKARARGDRLDMFGNFGVVVTAYPQSDLTQELGCSTALVGGSAHRDRLGVGRILQP